jgi:LacI family transcriptional regulator
MLVDPSFRKQASSPDHHLMLPHALIIRGSSGPVPD